MIRVLMIADFHRNTLEARRKALPLGKSYWRRSNYTITQKLPSHLALVNKCFFEDVNYIIYHDFITLKSSRDNKLTIIRNWKPPIDYQQLEKLYSIISVLPTGQKNTEYLLICKAIKNHIENIIEIPSFK